ncbi:hypothetical protein PoB_007152000 [Plakobranchus ocellatus]|uniref:Uncharacterized protein n=1 Tax=Plakobranchus ocellatus TaxID=259542 RepID=A0AAV4DLS3_9GAST|nr:hypothetical protein PoB_007152000 [Plakobranchus ocellatus]
MHCMAVALAISINALLTTDANAQDYNHTVQLMSSLFSNYDRTVRPILDQSSIMTINTDMLLAAITNVDEKDQTIAVRIYFFAWWEDELLTWTPADHGNVTVINPLISQLWMPTFNLARAVYDQQLLVDTSDMTPLYVNSTGTVVWSPNVYLQQLCKMDMTKFPYDQHNCTFQIYLVMFDVNQASQHDSFLCIVVKIFELDIVTAHTSPSLIQYSENNEWKLKSSEMRVLTFDSGISPPIRYISLSLVIQRRPRYFLLNLLFPTLALSFLNILVFVLPADSGEKVGYSITVLLSVMLMMGVTTDVMPEASDVVPLITQFLTALTVISILTVATTVVILLIHHRREEEENEERKKQTSFIEIIKQKLASRKSIRPSEKAVTPRDLGNQWVHKSQNDTPVPSPNKVFVEKKSPPEMFSSGNGHLNSTTQMALVDMINNGEGGIIVDSSQKGFQASKGAEAFISINNDQDRPSFKERRGAGGVGGLASVLFRRKGDRDDKAQTDDSGQSKGGDADECTEGTSNAEEIFKYLSMELDMLSFWFFLIAWIIVTMSYLIAILT